MLVHTDRQKLILKVRNPDMVCHVIPTARQFQYKGVTMVGVPHRLDEVRVLRNMGIRAPSPVLHYYSWPRSEHIVPHPFMAQRETAQFLTLNPKAFVLNDMGTGKTLATLWAYDYLKSLGIAVKLLVLSPLSTLERVWGDEIFKHFPHLNFCIVHGEKAKRQKLLADDSFDVYILNHHGICVVEQEIIAKQFTTLVVDEGAIFRNPGTKLWKALYRISKTIDRIWWLTGTPTPNAPTDAWAQCRIVAPERVPNFAGKFRDMVMRQFGPFKWVPRETATQIVFEAMQPAVRFTRDQCLDMPPALYHSRDVVLTSDQATAYKHMLTTLYMEYGGTGATAVNDAVKVSKLMQIVCGVVYGAGGVEVVLPCKPRIDAVLEVIEQAATKTIVFVPFKAAAAYVRDELTAKGLKVGFVTGDVPAAERARIFKAFQDGDLDALVAQPQAMSHGLTLTAANTIIWYAPTTSNETYEQANARVTRPGQKHTQHIVHLAGTPIERKAYDRLKNRQKMQGFFLDAVEEAQRLAA